MTRFHFSIFAAIATFSLIFSTPAHAYIDMGTGSMIFQMLAAGLVGFLFTVKMYWVSIKAKTARFMARVTGKPLPPETGPAPHDSDRNS
jgi:ABC-type uncharacterized transport system permease subunit